MIFLFLIPAVTMRFFSEELQNGTLKRTPPPKPTEGGAAQGNAGQECLVIEYAPREADQEPPKLYVPVSEAHLVSKYVGAGKARPPLNTLGGGRWAKAKAQAEKAIRDFAGELLAIQAARESQPRPAFGADQPWQREFEASFFYEETPDQPVACFLSDKGVPPPLAPPESLG